MYNGRIPSGINQPSQSLLNVDVDGVSVLSLTTSSIYTGVSFIGSSISASFFSGSGEYLYDLQMDNVVGYKDRITSGSNVVLVDSVAGMLVNSNAIFDQDVSVTGSIAVDGDVFVGGNLTVIGSIDAFELNTTYISSSIVYASGSNIFGDAVDDRHEFTGSVYVSGAFSIPTYTGDPPNGEIGQLYFNTNNNNIYRFTGVWEAAAGESGTSGTGGTSGTSGTSGSGGTSGVDGTGGTSGTSGSGGTSGTSGSGGTSGTSGSGGTAGTSGTSGSGGSSGTTGSSGTSGVDGADGISAGRLYYLNNSQNSDVSGYKVLSEVPTAGATQTINIALSQNEQNRLVQQFITPELGFTIIPSGVQVFKLFYTIAASGDLVDAYVTIELANSVGVGYGTVVSAAAVPIQYNSGNPIEVDVNVVLSQLSINESDRMIAKLYLNNNDNQVNNVVFSTENGYYSYVITSVGVVAGTSGTSGVDGTSGTSGTNGSAGTAGTSGVDGTSGTSGFLTLEGATDNGILTLNGAAPNATVESNLTFDGSKLTVTDSVLATDRYESSAVSKRDKYWVWNTATHSIGMVDDASFGGLDSDYAMTFQMNASTGSGFLWGNDLHDNAQGAMALTTDGKLTIAKSVRVGYGESDNSALPDGIGIDVSGSALLNDFSAAGTGSVGGLLTVAGNVVPSEDDVYSLGLPDKRWDTLYLSSASLFLGNAELQGTSDGYISGAFSGSFYGDGSNLSGVTSYTDADTLDFINSIEVISGSVSIDRISGVNYGIFEITLTSSINIEHNLNTLYPIVQVYSDLGEQFIPESVVIVDSDEIKLTFGEDVSGSAIIGKGGDVIGTYTLNQYLYTGSITIDRIDGTNYSVYEIPLTESITIKHDLGFSTPLVQIYKADGEQFIPESIRALNEDTVKITIGQQISGSVVISKGGDVIGNYSSSISYVTPVWGLIQDIPVGLVSSSQQILGGDVTVSGSLEVDGALLLNSGISITGSLTTTSDATGKLLDLNGYKYYSVSGVIEVDNNILYAFQLPNNSSGAGKLQMIHSGSDFREILWSYSNNTGSVTTKDRIFDELEASYTASIASDGIFKISTTNGKNISIFSLLETFNDGISKLGNEVYALQYLVVGGGGGGANAGGFNGYFGGGGGAGGYRSSVVGETSGGNSLVENFFELVLGNTYEVSIGAGGTPNVSGSISYFSNVVSLGGGSGNWLNASNPVSNGGSGGGASRFNATNNFFGTGTAGQGFNGDSATNFGGGGGAGELGSTDADGYGGDGLQSNITGTPTYYAGGGGAGGILNSGGLGGGASGASASANALPATANTGGGGGGSAYNAALPGYFLGSAGGSGVVIIKFPSNLTLQGGAGLTYTEVDNGDPNTTVIRFTAGTGNISLIKP